MNNMEMENNLKFIVYCTTNIVNNKIYIGVHKTENPDIFDGYIVVNNIMDIKRFVDQRSYWR